MAVLRFNFGNFFGADDIICFLLEGAGEDRADNAEESGDHEPPNVPNKAKGQNATQDTNENPAAVGFGISIST